MADLHLTTKPLDEYRWDFLKWIIDKIEEWKIDRIDILGDLTDKKDHHPEALVNRLIDLLEILAGKCKDGIYILKGNHDCIDEQKPFFRFLSKMQNIKFITYPLILDKEIFLPFTRNPIQEWAGLKLEQFDYINMHQLMHGAIVGNHLLVNNLTSDYWENIKGRILSGDVHAHQKVGKVEYVGAPYHIDFGDSYEGHIIIRDGNRERNIFVPSIRKLKINITGDVMVPVFGQINKGDQVSVVVRIRESEMYQWRELRNSIRKDVYATGGILCSLSFEKIKDVKVISKGERHRVQKIETPEQIFDRFCKKEKVAGKAMEIGELLMRGNK